MNMRKTCLLCVGGFTTLVVVWLSGLLLQTGHAGPAAGVGSVYATNMQQETGRHRRPVSLRMLAHVLYDCEQKNKPIHPGVVRWASRALPSEEVRKVSDHQLFGLTSFQSVSRTIY